MTIHPTSIISKNATIGKNVFVGPFCNLQENIIIGDNTKIFGLLNAYDCTIGDYCKIGTSVEIQNDVTIGNKCKIQSHTFICEGVCLEGGVFVGHNVVFINDIRARAINSDGSLKAKYDWKLLETKVCFGASIGSAAVILPVKIGKWATIGAGTVVTKDVPDFGLVYGVPAELKGFTCKCGSILTLSQVIKENKFDIFLMCKDCSELIPIQKNVYKQL